MVGTFRVYSADHRWPSVVTLGSRLVTESDQLDRGIVNARALLTVRSTLLYLLHDPPGSPSIADKILDRDSSPEGTDKIRAQGAPTGNKEDLEGIEIKKSRAYLLRGQTISSKRSDSAGATRPYKAATDPPPLRSATPTYEQGNNGSCE